MTFPTLLTTILGTIINVALISYGSRRLLNIPYFSLTRTVVAGLLGQLGGTTIINALGAGFKDPVKHKGAAIAMVGLGTGAALLLAMAILVTWQALLPAGTIPTPAVWPSRLRNRWRRTVRYWQITRIFARAGVGPLLRTGTPLTASVARSLSRALDRSGVVFTKFGQVLSTRRDLLPPEFTAELSKLQDKVTPLPWQVVEQVLASERELDAFASIDHEPLAAASIAQVHTARLTTGEKVVIKVRRPDALVLVDRDLDIIGRLARRLESRAGWARTMGVRQLAAGFATALREELDFQVEASNLASVHDTETVRIPRAYPELSSDQILVMEQLDGQPISKAPLDALSRQQRTNLARGLLDTMLKQILIHGVFHADPHPGNVLLLREPDGSGPVLGLIDFGSVGRLDATLRAALQRLLLGIDRSDPVGVTDALLEVTARPDELDEQALERSIGSLLVRLRGASPPNVAMFAELFRIVARHRLAVPPEFAAVFRALATLEGGLTLLAPDFDIVAEAERFGATAFTGASAAALGEAGEAIALLRDPVALLRDPMALKALVANEAVTLLPMLRRLPRRVDRIIAATEGGRLSVNVRLFADERDRKLIGNWLQQVVTTVLAATAGLMAVVLLTIKGGPVMAPAVSLFQFLGYCLLVICSLLALRVLAVVFTSSGRRE